MRSWEDLHTRLIVLLFIDAVVVIAYPAYAKGPGEGHEPVSATSFEIADLTQRLVDKTFIHLTI